MAKGSKSGASAKQEAQADATPDGAASGLPLFYKQPAALEKTRHAKATLSGKADYRFAAETNSIALNAIEFIEAAKHYPIVFSAGEQPAALAIVGLEKGNYFINKSGEWTEGAYVPAYVRQYPFVFFEDQKNQKFLLCVDEASPHFSLEGEKDGKALFNEDGSPSPMTNQALEFCNSYYRHHAITRNFIQDLVKHKLLSPYQSSLKLASGKTLTLAGFSMLDEKAFNALSDEVVLEFRRKGWLAFIYLALASTSNWKRIGHIAEQAA